MNDKFDELTKAMAQSVTRRGVLKKFGVGLAGIALASFGLMNKAAAGPIGGKGECARCLARCAPNDDACIQKCATKCCVICN
jgi:hypothetical protein